MRVVLVNWAHLADGASSGGGVNGYCQSLAVELAARGHDVTYLSSGLTYTRDADPSRVGPCKARRMPDFRGVRVVEIINSPVVAPGIFQFSDPEAEIASPALDAEFRAVLEALRPDVVHFHNVEGIAASTIGVRGTWARFFSLHNYHTICPQVYLLRGGVTPCRDSRNGHACATCITTGDPASERLGRCGPMPPPPPVHVPLHVSVTSRLRRIAQRISPPPPVPPSPQPMPGAPFDPAPAQRWTEPAAGTDPSQLAPLLNTIEPEPASDLPLNGFGRRRAAMVDALNSCDRVLAVSRFVAEVFASRGVKREVLSVQPIGTRMTDLAAKHPEMLAPPPADDGVRPLRLVFMGYHNRAKGLHVLADALDGLAPAALRRVHLAVFAKDIAPFETRMRRLEGRLAGLDIRPGYRYDEVPSLLSGRDAGIVPSVWWDNGPQTVMEFFACGLPVIGAELGGIPDLVRDGQNGLLFRGNDRDALRSVLLRLVTERGLCDRLRAGVTPPRSISAHADELLAAYATLRTGGGS